MARGTSGHGRRLREPPSDNADGGAGRTVEQTARDHLRAVAGGLLVGLPLLWTMEVWDDGAVLAPGKILVLLGIGFAVVVGFNELAGFREERTWPELIVDSVQAMGLSALVAALALFVLGRLDADLGMPTLVGRIAIESIPVAFGASLASTVMADPGEDDEGGPGRPPVEPIGRLIVGGAGALYFALNIAPTDEVRILAASATPPQLLLAIGVSLAVGLVIVFHAEFRGSRARSSGGGPLDGAEGETVAVYVLGLLVGWVLLWAFGSTDGMAPQVIVAQVVLLGVVATFGAAGARLLLGSPAEQEAR